MTGTLLGSGIAEMRCGFVVIEELLELARVIVTLVEYLTFRSLIVSEPWNSKELPV